MLKDIVAEDDSDDEEEEEGGEQKQPVKKKPVGTNGANSGTNGANSGPKSAALTAARASSRGGGAQPPNPPEIRRLKEGDVALVMAVGSEWDFDAEDARWAKGESVECTEWYKGDLLPYPHTPLFSAVILDCRAGNQAKHFAWSGDIPDNHLSMKVRYLQKKCDCFA